MDPWHFNSEEKPSSGGAWIAASYVSELKKLVAVKGGCASRRCTPGVPPPVASVVWCTQRSHDLLVPHLPQFESHR